MCFFANFPCFSVLDVGTAGLASGAVVLPHHPHRAEGCLQGGQQPAWGGGAGQAIEGNLIAVI